MPVRSLPRELQEKAERELNEKPHRIQEDINHIKEWASKQPHLKIREDDQWILSFLRSCKFSLQRTKDTLDFYYTMRSLTPELFLNRNLLAPEINVYFTDRILARLPTTSDILAPQRFFIRCKKTDSHKVSIINAFRSILMLTDALLYNDDMYVINGQEIIVDMENFDYGYTTQLTPDVLRKGVLILQEAYPVRIKGIYFLNLPSFAQVALNIVTSLLSKKLSKRIHLYSKHDMEEFYKHISRSVLPQEYGGSGGSFDKLSDELREFVEKQRDWLLEDSQQYGCDEARRPEKRKQPLEMFQCEGFFRKLEID